MGLESLLNLAMQQIVSIAVGGVCANIWYKLKARQQKDDAMQSGLCALLRHTIRQACKHRIEKGWVPMDEKDDVLNCYAEYEKLVKNNGVINDCVEQFRALPHLPLKE